MTLQEVLKSVENSYGRSSVQEGVELKPIKRLALPARSLNRVLYGGLPYGRLIEFSGAEHSGKTTTALLALGAYQRLGTDKKCVFIDAEGTYDSVWASKLGVNNEEVIKITPENMTAEETLQMIVDIASYPYGIDHHYALSKGLNCQILSSIPCKYAYGYAGKMVADEIERELENA